jgi:hypothetical protein
MQLRAGVLGAWTAPDPRRARMAALLLDGDAGGGVRLDTDDFTEIRSPHPSVAPGPLPRFGRRRTFRTTVPAPARHRLGWRGRHARGGPPAVRTGAPVEDLPMMATMATAYSFLTLILCLLAGGGNDLLDYLPSEAYWAEKGVTVSVESMIAQLGAPAEQDVAELVAELGSPDPAARDEAAAKILAAGPGALAQVQAAADSPDAEVRRRARTLARQLGATAVEQAVRRLMAIRTLGELGKPEGAAALQPLLASKELFVAEYARAAIDAIEGGRPAVRRAAAPPVLDDVWLLPAQCRTVGQLVPRGGSESGPIGFAELMAAVRTGQGDDGDDDGDSGVDEESVAGVTRMVLALAEQVGNVRIDAVTIGIAGNPVPTDPGQKPGSVTVIVRGLYDAERARTLARSERVSAREVEGVEVFEPDGEQAWLMPSDTLFVFTASPDPDALPLAEMVAVANGGTGTLGGVDGMRKLVGTVDTKQVLWGAAIVTPEQRDLPAAGAFDTITLVGSRQEKSTLRLAIRAQGSDAARVKEAATIVKRHAEESAEFLEGMQVAPIVTLAVELLKSVKVDAPGTTATVTASLRATPAGILSLPMMSDADYERNAEPVAPHPRLQRPAAKEPE